MILLILLKGTTRGDSEEGVPARSRRSEAIEDARREAELTGPRAMQNETTTDLDKI